MKHMMDAPFRWGIGEIRDIERWDPRFAVREVATLPDVANLFRERVAFTHRLAAAFVSRVMPGFAGAYRLSRISIARAQT